MTAIIEARSALAAAFGGGVAADLAALALLEAECLGQPRFGLAMVDEWAATGGTPLAIEAEKSVQWLNTADRFAPLAVAEATLALQDIAARKGVAVIFLRGVRGFGRLAPFVRHLADQGLLAMAGAEGPPFVAPYNGTAPVIGTNPFAVAVGQGEAQVVIDVATSAATMAEVKAAKAEGRPLREGIAFDREGGPTINAAEVAALMPRDGQLGSLLGLIVELLAGVAGAGRDDPKGRGVFLLALDPSKADASLDWPKKLAGLRADWTEGGGYWPRGGRGADTLPDGFDTRFAAALARLRA